MSKEKKIITYSSMIICFVLISIYCLSPLCVGLNHGGNNSSIEASLGLDGVNDGFFYTGYNIIESNGITNDSSFYNIVRPIIRLTSIFSNYFDIRILSFIYTLILIISIFYLNKYINFSNRIGNIVFAFLTIFVAFDLSYLLYLNTLYAEAAFYVLLLFDISLYIKLITSKRPQIPTTVLFFFIAIIICGLKSNMYILFLPFLAMGIYLFTKRKGYTFRFLVGILSLLLIVYPILKYDVYLDSDKDKFHSVFYGILYENEEPEKTLYKLGLDEKYAELAGKNQFNELPLDINSEEFRENFYNKISYWDITRYYITNPSEYIKQFKYVGYNSMDTAPKYVGNYTVASGKDAYATATGFNIYNIIKSKLYPKTLWFIYLIPFALIFLLILYRKNINKGIVVLGCSLSVMSMMLFNIPMITSGLVDIVRTMAIFNIAFDTVVVMIVCILLYISTQRKQEFKDKYGLSQ